MGQRYYTTTSIEQDVLESITSTKRYELEHRILELEAELKKARQMLQQLKTAERAK